MKIHSGCIFIGLHNCQIKQSTQYTLRVVSLRHVGLFAWQPDMFMYLVSSVM